MGKKIQKLKTADEVIYFVQKKNSRNSFVFPRRIFDQYIEQLKSLNTATGNEDFIDLIKEADSDASIFEDYYRIWEKSRHRILRIYRLEPNDPILRELEKYSANNPENSLYKEEDLELVSFSFRENVHGITMSHKLNENEENFEGLTNFKKEVEKSLSFSSGNDIQINGISVQYQLLDSDTFFRISIQKTEKESPNFL